MYHGNYSIHILGTVRVVTLEDPVIKQDTGGWTHALIG